MSNEKPKPKNEQLYTLFVANITAGVRAALEKRRLAQLQEEKSKDTNSDKNKGS